MLKTEAKASNIMDPLGYWREYPERDLEHVRRYPCVVEPLNEEDVWTGIPLALYVRLAGGHAEDLSSCLRGLEEEIRKYAGLPYVAAREVRIAFWDARGCAPLDSRQLETLLQSAASLPTAAAATWAFLSRPQDLNGAKAEVLARRGCRRAVLCLSAPGPVPREQLRLLQDVGLPEVGVELGMWTEGIGEGELWSLLADLKAAGVTLLQVAPNGPHADALLSSGYRMATYRDFVTASPAMRFPEHILYYGLDVLGLGPGAWGFLKGVVYRNTARPAAYWEALLEDRLPIQEALTPTARQRLSGSLANGLRLLKISRERFKVIHGFDLLQASGEKIEELAGRGFLELEGDAVKVTYPQGYQGLETIIRSVTG